VKVSQKRFSRFFLLVSCVLLVLLLLGCGGGRTATSVAGRYTREGFPDEYLILNQDGTYTKRARVLTDEPEISSGNWKLETNTIVFVDRWAAGPSENEVVTLKGNKIIIEYPYALFAIRNERRGLGEGMRR